MRDRKKGVSIVRDRKKGASIVREIREKCDQCSSFLTVSGNLGNLKVIKHQGELRGNHMKRGEPL